MALLGRAPCCCSCFALHCTAQHCVAEPRSALPAYFCFTSFLCLYPIRRRRIRRWFDDDTRAIGTRQVAISRIVTHHGEIARRVSGRDAFAIRSDFVLGHPVLSTRK